VKRLLSAAALALYGCAHGGEPDLATLASNSDQVIWEAGQKALDKKQWESARQYFRRIIDGFPQSEYGPASRLALGDTYFREGGTANNILAASAYREFLTIYPSHPKSEYAQHQVAESFFKQKNGPDRDQTATHEALEEFEKLVNFYPSSPHGEAARARIRECRQGLARHEFMVGHFYQRTRQAYGAAIARYEGILANFGDYEGMDEVLFRLAECLQLSGRGPEALPHLDRLLKEYPQSEHTEPARKLMNAIHPQVEPAPSW